MQQLQLVSGFERSAVVVDIAVVDAAAHLALDWIESVQLSMFLFDPSIEISRPSRIQLHPFLFCSLHRYLTPTLVCQ